MQLLKLLLLIMTLASCALPASTNFTNDFYEEVELAQVIIGRWGGWYFSMYEFYGFDEDGSFWEHRILSKDREQSLQSMRKTTTKWQLVNNKIVVTGNAPDAETGEPGPLPERQISFEISNNRLHYKDNQGGNAGGGFERLKSK